MSAQQQYAAEAADPFCIAPATAAQRLSHLPWQRFAVLGDSVAAGVRDPLDGYRDGSFADRLTEALSATRPGFSVVNLAVPWLTITEIREKQLEDALAFAPDVVMVTAGGNDAFREFDPDKLLAELDALLRPLAQVGATVLTVGLFDLARSGLVPSEHAAGMAHRFDELDLITARLTRSLGGIHVNSHQHPLAADPGIYASDRIHANARGHAVAFAAIVDAIAAQEPSVRRPRL